MARVPAGFRDAADYKAFQAASRRSDRRMARGSGSLAAVRSGNTNNNSARRDARQSTFRGSNSLFNKSITGGAQVKRANGKLRGSISGG